MKKGDRIKNWYLLKDTYVNVADQGTDNNNVFSFALRPWPLALSP